MDKKDSKEKALNDVKTFIRSVLITEKDGFTVRELNIQYSELLGERIPHAMFGFTTVESFLHSITDTVSFFTGRGGEERVRHVSVETTKHIEQMVSKQKTNSKSKKKVFRDYGRSTKRRGGGSSFRGRPNTQNSSRGPLLSPTPLLQIPNYRQNTTCPQYYPDKYNRPQPIVRPNVSSGYRSCRWPGSNFAENDSAYQRTWYPDYHYQSQTKNCYPSNQQRCEMRRQNSSGSDDHQDRLSLQGASCGRSRGRGRKVGADQKFTQLESQQDSGYSGGARRKIPGYSSSRSFSSDSESVRYGSDQFEDEEQVADKHLKQTEPFILVKDICEVSQDVQNKVRREQEADRQTEPFISAEDFCEVSQDVQNKVRQEQEADRQTEPFISAEDTCEVSQDTQNKVRQVLLKAPKGLWANRLPVMYKEMFDKNFPMREQGFHSVIAMMSTMPHIVRIMRPYEQGDWMLFDATLPLDLADEPLNKGKAFATHISRGQGYPEDKCLERDEELTESVRQVLQAHSDGIPLHQFPDKYQEMTGRILNPKTYGEEDMNSLLVLLSEQGVVRMEYLGPESTRLYARPTSDVRRYNYLKDGYKPHSFEVTVPERRLVFDEGRFQQDVVGPGVCYKPAVLDDLQKGDGTNKVFYEMIVSNVVSPGLFWVQKRTDNPALDDLMDGLEAAYTQQSELYRMPRSMMQLGQVCATLFPEDNNWHRAVITGGTSSMVEVYFVDYGNTCCVPSSTVYFLKKKYIQLPVQAIQAKLATVVPPAGHKTFTRDSKHALLDMVISRPLMALILDIQNRVLSLLLVDTNGTSDVHINDQMVAQGHAQWEEARPAVREDAVLNPVYSEGLRFVRRVICSPEISFLTIHLAGSLYVSSPEVSGLFWEDDILACMLQQSCLSVPVPKVVVYRQHCPALFEELYRYGAYFVNHSTLMLSLYSLDCLPLLLDLFGNQSPAVDELKDFVMEHLKAFDPNDPFWKGQDEDVGSEDTDTVEEDDGKLSLSELEIVLHSMQIKRKLILQRITSQPGCRADDIQKLEQTENYIHVLQDLVQTLEGNESGTDAGVEQPASSATSTKIMQPLPKATSSLSTSDPSTPTSVKTNVVAPMVKPPPSPPADLALNPYTYLQDAVLPAGHGDQDALLPNPTSVPDLDQIAATNDQLVELIRQQDEMLQGMLGQGGGAAEDNPSSGLALLMLLQPRGIPAGDRNPADQPQPGPNPLHPQFLTSPPPLLLPPAQAPAAPIQGMHDSLGHPTLPPNPTLAHPHPPQPLPHPGGQFAGGYLPHRAALIAPSMMPPPAPPDFSPRFLPPSAMPVRTAGPGMMGMAAPGPGFGGQAMDGGGGGDGGCGLSLQHQLQQRQLQHQHQQLLMRHQRMMEAAPQLASSGMGFPPPPPAPVPSLGDVTLAYSSCPDVLPSSSSYQASVSQHHGPAPVTRQLFPEVGGGVAGPQGQGEGQLLPGMLPLLQSFKASCSVRPNPHPR